MEDLITKEELESCLYDLKNNPEKINRNGNNFFSPVSKEVAKEIIDIRDKKRKEEIEKSKGLSRPYEVEKGVQVLKYIINKHPNPDIYNVLKMLYFADKIHLLEYGKLIIPDKYIKLEYGPVPSLCYDIIRFVRSTHYYYSPFDNKIKGEIQVFEDPNTGKRIRLRNLTEPDFGYLSNSNIKCLNEVIEKYGKYDFNQLKKESHDDIYNSVIDMNEDITVFDMANFLDRSGKLTEHLRNSYPYKEYK